jgi:protocatechuate 3,4-dioxygenase beta subunit
MPPKPGAIMMIPHDKGVAEMIISGIIYKSDGITPYPGVALYAYHTDEKGKYSKSGKETGVQKWHGRHHGWCVTDSKGSYEIRTIRPAPYPGNTIAAHVHTTLMEPGKKP